MPRSRSALNPRGAPAARASRQAPEGTGARTDAHAAQRIHRGTPATVGPGRGALIRVMAGAPVFLVGTSFVLGGGVVDSAPARGIASRRRVVPPGGGLL